MKATDFVKGSRYLPPGHDEPLEFSHIGIHGVWFLDNFKKEWFVDFNGMIGFASNIPDQFRGWKEYIEPKETTADHLPEGITRDMLHVHRYAVGDKLATAKGLTIDNFEYGIQFVKWSQNPNEKSKFLHCHGFNKQSGQFTFFVCKLKS